jgi:hypothetical protein
MKTQKRLPLRWKLGGLAVLCLLLLGIYIYRYLHSPDRILHQAFAALNRRDAEALVALAYEKERRELNLTPQTVTAILRETWWRDSRIKPRVVVKGYRTKFQDIRTYAVEVSGFVPNKRAIFFEPQVYLDPTGAWRLGLSELLYCLPKVCNGAEGDYAKDWDVMARRAGIRGVVCAEGGTRYNDGTFTPEISLTRP